MFVHVISTCSLPYYIYWKKPFFKGSRGERQPVRQTQMHHYSDPHILLKSRKWARGGGEGREVGAERGLFATSPPSSKQSSLMDGSAQFYMLSHWVRSCRSLMLSHPILTVGQPVQALTLWPLTGKPAEHQFINHWSDTIEEWSPDLPHSRWMPYVLVIEVTKDGSERDKGKQMNLPIVLTSPLLQV